MSLLDPLVRGDAANLAPLQAAIDAVEAITGAQQTQLDGLAAQLDGLGDAQAAIDTLQNAAIDATEAVNTAQSAAQAAMQAAQDAAATVDATHSADITALQTTVGSHTTSIGTLGTTVGSHTTSLATQQGSIDALLAAQPNLETLSTVDLRMFVPGRVLTDANIDDAIDAAIAYAMSQTGPGLDGPGYDVIVPAGKWTLSRPHAFPAFGAYRCAVGLRGAGRDKTIFLVTTDVAASAVFTFGAATYTGPGVAMTFGLRVSGFSVMAAVEGSCNRTGLRFYGAVNPAVRDVRVRGLCHAASTADQARGIEVLPVLENGQYVNSQFFDMRDVDIFSCMTGLYVRLSYPVTLDNVMVQGCFFQNAIIQGSTVTWLNSGIQGGLSDDPNVWYGNRDMPNTVSGFDSTAGLGSGTGATCGTQTSKLCVVTGLSGLDPWLDKARWIRLTPAGASANELKARGVYKIERVLSATSCTIRKGSNHTSQGSLSWQICECEGQNTLTIRNTYNETLRKATIGGWRDSQGGSAYVIESAEFQGGQFIMEADNIRSVTIRNIRESNGAAKAVQLAYVDWSEIEADVSRVECDEYSWPGMRCLDNTSFPNGVYSKGTARTANGGSQVRLLAALREMGAVEVWDVRATSSLSLTGANVNSITGLIKGNVLTPGSAAPAGAKPTYTALDPLLDMPAIVGVSGAGAARSHMAGLIAASHLPNYPYSTTIVLIGRCPDTVVNNFRRAQVKTEDPGGGFVQHIIGLHDNQYAATGSYAYYRVYNNFYPNNEGYASYSLTTDTDPHIWIAGAASPMHLGAQIMSWDKEVWKAGGVRTAHPSHFVGRDLQVGIGAEYAGINSGSLIWTVFAVIPHALSHAEHQKLVDLARHEFPLEM
jgi:hypothetical protein